MISSTKDIIEGKIHQVKGKVKEVVGLITNDIDIENEGKGEKVQGKVQEKVGLIKRIAGQ